MLNESNATEFLARLRALEAAGRSRRWIDRDLAGRFGFSERTARRRRLQLAGLDDAAAIERLYAKTLYTLYVSPRTSPRPEKLKKDIIVLRAHIESLFRFIESEMKRLGLEEPKAEAQNTGCPKTQPPQLEPLEGLRRKVKISCTQCYPLSGNPSDTRLYKSLKMG